MSPEDAGKKKKREKALINLLNLHGYGFQYAVVKKIMELNHDYYFPWEYVAPEFPVDIQGPGTRIDFILRHKRIPLYILAECKRVNPRFADWCFMPIPYRARTAKNDAVRIEFISGEKKATFNRHVIHPSEGIYEIAKEIKTDVKGDAQPTGRGREAIEDAATQICRGLNGIIEFSLKHLEVLSDRNFVGFIPVIFTTAKLYISRANIGDADLETGNLPPASIDLEERPWIFCHYYQSPGLKHSIPSLDEATNLEDMLYREYVRTIPIVNALGIGQFLNYDNWRDPHWL